MLCWRSLTPISCAIPRYPPLLKTAEELVKHYFQPPRMDDSMVAITAGSQDGFSRSLEMVLSKGDYIIVENPTFAGALNVVSRAQK